jgi:hypothetical protein
MRYIYALIRSQAGWAQGEGARNTLKKHHRYNTHWTKQLENFTHITLSGQNGLIMNS